MNIRKINSIILHFLICFSIAIPQTVIAASNFSDIDPVIINIPKDKPNLTPTEGNGKNQTPPLISIGPTLKLGTIDQTLVPGVTCPLIDNQPRKDLVAAAENLAKNIAPLKQCKDSTDVDTMQGYLTSISEAGKSLKSYIQQPELVTNDAGKLKNIQDNVDSLIRGINNVSQAFATNSLLNSSCAKSMMKGTDLILSLSDLVQSVTPFALSALQMNPAFAPAIPYVIGLSAAGNVAKVIKKIHDEMTLQMDDPKVRQAVLQSICEYTRIVQRANSYKAAKRGDLKEVNDHLGKINSLGKAVSSNFSIQAIRTVQAGNRVKESLNLIKKTATDDQVAINDLRQQISGEQDSGLTCYIVRGLVSQAGNANELPTRALFNLKVALQNKSYISESAQIIQLGLLKAEASLRSQILSQINNNSPHELMACAKEGRSYIEALSRLVQSTQNIAVGMQNKVNEKLETNDNPEVRDLAKIGNSSQIEKDKLDILTKSALVSSGINVDSSKSKGLSDIELLQTMNRDNGVLGDANIDRNLMEIKSALFGPRAGWIAGDSPALSWYLDSDKILRQRHQEFANEYASLILEARAFYTKTGKGDFSYIDKSGQRIYLSVSESNKQIMEDFNSAITLGPLNLNTISESSPAHHSMCTRLDGMLNIWQGILDHLGSMMLYCSYLTDYIDTSFDKNIVQACKGIKDWNGNIYKKSDLLELRLLLASKSVKHAKLISTKFDELKCTPVN